ncbi:MAG: tetratricopeptide repeat protein [Candidatus Aminicenantes bacterium]|nr:tetratricopeptide repeat protein [Candidatus Aminicenantes bacterium]
MIEKRFKVIFLVFLFLLSSYSAYAQEGRGQGRVSGTVKDESGNPIEGAEIRCESLEHNLALKTTSDKSGNWAIMGFGRSYFRITASKKGYFTSETRMRLSHFQNPPIDFILKSVESTDSPTEESVEISKELFTEATGLFNEGKYSAALSLFQDFLERHPELFQIRINIGNCYREMGEYEEALAEYAAVVEKLEEENPDLKGNRYAAQALTNIGETYLKMGEMEKAQPFLEKAIEIFPKDHAGAFNVAEIYFKDGQIDQAIEYYNLAIQIKPDWPLTYLKIGYAYVNKGDYDQAIVSFQEFLKLAPDHNEAESVRALIAQLEKIKKM